MILTTVPYLVFMVPNQQCGELHDFIYMKSTRLLLEVPIQDIEVAEVI